VKCPKCGKENLSDAKFCTMCFTRFELSAEGEKKSSCCSEEDVTVTQPKKRKSILLIFISLVLIGLVAFGTFRFLQTKNPELYYSRGLEAMEENNYALAMTLFQQTLDLEPDYKEVKEELSSAKIRFAANFMAENELIPYRMLQKDANKLAGIVVWYEGEIFNIQEEHGITTIQMNVTPKEYGGWDDQIYVVYNGSVNVYKDDVVLIVGIVDGQHAYKSVAGWDMTVPKISATVVIFDHNEIIVTNTLARILKERHDTKN